MAELLSEIRSAFKQSPPRIRIDFSETVSLSPEGTILLYAELQQLTDNFRTQIVECIPAKHETVDGVLEHLGIYGMFNHKSNLILQGDHVVKWEVMHGVLVESNAFGPKIEGLKLESSEARDLFKAVSEAVSNVLGHAYIAIRHDGLDITERKGWWLFCHESENSLYVVVCDLGIGIPRSLPLQHGREKVASALNRIFGRRHYTDGHKIYAALRMGRSRTVQAHRGRGFNDIMNAIDAKKGSWVQVFSNHGLLRYKQKARQPSIKTFAFKRSLLGTIICWRFPLEGSENEY